MIAFLTLLLIGCCVPLARGGGESQPVTITIAVSETISFRYEHHEGRIADRPTYTRKPPLIPTELEFDTLRPYFDVVIRNCGSNELLLPRFDGGQVKLKVTDGRNEEYMLSVKSPHLGGMGRPVHAHVLSPGGCLVNRVYMDWYSFPPNPERKVVKLQAIYEVPKVTRELRIRVFQADLEARRTIELSEDLGLWHGTVRSEVVEVISTYDGPIRRRLDSQSRPEDKTEGESPTP